MDSNTLTKIQNSNNLTHKVVSDIWGSTDGEAIYHYKPSYPCRIISAGLNLIAASAGSGDPEVFPVIAIGKAIVTEPECSRDVVLSGITEDSAVSDSEILTIATGGSDLAYIQAAPGADYQTAKDIDPDANEALKIAIEQCTTTALQATLILEIQPL